MVDAQQNLTGSRDLTTPLSRMVCHPWARTCYYQPIYQILSFCLHPLQRYKMIQNTEMAWSEVVREHSRSLEIASFDGARTNSY